MKNWKFWDWIGYGALAVAAFVMAFDAALRNAPALTKLLPGLAESNLWAFTPGMLVIVATVVLMFRGTHRQGASRKSDETKSFLPPNKFPKIRYESEWDFTLLPLQFTVDLAATYPQVEVSFYALSFLARPIKLTDVDLSLHLSSRPALEDITFRQKDIQVDPRDYAVIFCRRQLTNAECTSPPAWKSGRESASFTLSAKATDGVNTIPYGPVAAKVIEGWVNAPPRNADQQS